MVYGASKRISTLFGSVATSEDGILYSSAIDFWSSFDDDEEEALAERKRLFVLLVAVVLLFRLLGDEVVASEDESMRSDVAVDMSRESGAFWT